MSRAPAVSHLFAALAVLCAGQGRAAELFPLVVEPLRASQAPSMGADAGARNLSTLLRTAGHGTDALQTALSERAAPRWVGVATTVGLDALVTVQTSWYQHEAFGHAAACRELTSIEPCTFTVGLVPPFGFDPRASFTWLPPNGGAYRAEMLAAGRNAQQLLTDELSRQRFRSGVASRTGSLLMVSQAVELTWETLRPSASNDLAQYFAVFAESSIPRGMAAYQLQHRLLLVAALLADPALWTSAWDYACLIGGCARPEATAFSWKFDDSRLLVRPRAVEGPAGLEVGAVAQWVRAQASWEAGVLVGIVPRLPSAKVWVGVPVVLHPQFELETRAAILLDSNGLGVAPSGALEVDATYWPTATAGIHLRAGYKGWGEWLGRQLRNGAYLQSGVVVRL